MIADDDDDDGLFSWAARGAQARHTDPSTSHDAAASVQDSAVFLELEVMRAIKRADRKGYDFGVNWWEAHLDLPDMEMSSISPRWAPLRRKHLIDYKRDDNGVRVKRPGNSTRDQLVFVLTPAGRALLDLHP